MIGLDLIITIQHSLECQNLVAAITPNANQALAPPPSSSVGLAITHQAQVSIAPQISNANQDLALALAPPPLSSVAAITHQAQVSIAPQTTSGFARAYQTFISNLGNSGTYQDINVGIESNTDLPLEVVHVLMDLHQNINDPRIWTRYQVNGPRTNNHLEGYHHSIKRKTFSISPPPSSSVALAITHQAQVAPQTSNANQDLALAPPPSSSVALATHQAQVSIAPQTSNANQDITLAPPPSSSVALAITHQAQSSIAPKTSNANQDLALAPLPSSSVALALHIKLHKLQILH
ncbi:unnamed protein product [Gordionus sp. m RMFG-2023]